MITVNNLLNEASTDWMKKPASKRTRLAYQKWAKSLIIKNGLMAISAPVSDGGTCQVCGEDGRCPGWHTPDDIKQFAQRIVKD